MVEYKSHCHGELLKGLVGYSYQLVFFLGDKMWECGNLSLVKKEQISED